jgi:hypothetical protein
MLGGDEEVDLLLAAVGVVDEDELSVAKEAARGRQVSVHTEPTQI